MSKRILYIAENAISPGGIVVYALLRGARAEDLLCFYSYTNITPAPEYQNRSHRIGNYRSLFVRAGRPHQFRPNLNPPHLSRPRPKGLKAKALFGLAHLTERLARLDRRMVVMVTVEGLGKQYSIDAKQPCYHILREALAERLRTSVASSRPYARHGWRQAIYPVYCGFPNIHD